MHGEPLLYRYDDVKGNVDYISYHLSVGITPKKGKLKVELSIT